MYFIFLILITTISTISSITPDDVSESLTLRPLTNGDFLLSLDVSVTSKGLEDVFKNPDDSNFIMDVMPIDVAKLYVKTKSTWFEANLGFGEWKDFVWGDRPDILINNGLSLIGYWPTKDKLKSYEHFTSLCYGLWGLTGSMFTNLVSEESFIHDLTDLYYNDYDVNSDSSSTVYVSSDFEDRACLDTFFKLRMLLPCLCTHGLVSIMGDERFFVRSSYRGVKFRVERVENDLVFKTRVQFTVPNSQVPNKLDDLFPYLKLPRNCKSISKSTVNLVFPYSLKSQTFTTVSFDYKDELSMESLNNTYSDLISQFGKGYEPLATLTELVFEVSELESRYLRVLKRVQSSLLIRVENLSINTKKLCVHQPLPYWLRPLLHSISLVVENLNDGKLYYKCSGAYCFSRNTNDLYKFNESNYENNQKNYRGNYNLMLDTFRHFMSPKYYKLLLNLYNILNPVPKLETSPKDPLMIYNLGKNWNNFGVYISIPPKSVLFLSVELSKDNITYEDIHLSAHRGQLIPSGLLIDIEKINDLSVISSFKTSNYFYFMTSFFSHIVLPDNTMVFNVMAFSGVVIAFIFGFIFNILTRDWNKTYKLK